MVSGLIGLMHKTRLLVGLCRTIRAYRDCMKFGAHDKVKMINFDPLWNSVYVGHNDANSHIAGIFKFRV